MFLDLDKTHAASFLNSFKNIPQKASPSGLTQDNGSNCERRILAYKKNKLLLIGILYIKNYY